MAFIRTRARKTGPDAHQLQYDVAGKREAVTFTDLAQAEHWCGIFNAAGVETGLKLLAEHLSPPAPDAPKVPTVREIVEEHIDNNTGMSSGTRGRARKEAERDIYPMLGDLPADQLDAAVGERWIKHLTGANRMLHGKPAPRLSGKTVQNRHGLLSSAVSRQVSQGNLPGNPIRGLQIPESEQVEMTFLTPAEWWIVHDSLSPHWRSLCTLLVGTGLRFGEATALRVGDIDLAARRIRVVRAWKENENGRRYIGPPKSKASKRSVGFDGALVPILRDVMNGRPAAELAFLNRAGNPILNGSFHSRGWTVAMEKAKAAGLEKRPRPHDLRHTFASWALEDGRVNVFKLAKVLGHDDVKVTQNRYGHLMPEALDDIARALGAALDRPVPLPSRVARVAER